MADQKYRFSWELLGDMSSGRPHLGNKTRLESYRLMQFAFRDVMEQHFGSDKTDRIFYESGKLAGVEFYKNILPDTKEFNVFVKNLQDTFRDMGIGILRIEEADMKSGSLVLTISEDLECSGLPDLGYVTCTYDEGFIAGLLESFTGSSFKVEEVDCWTTGDRTCRFAADMIK